MVWCNYCGKNRPLDHSEGYTCCTGCGRVVVEHQFSTEPTFAQGPGGQSVFVGNIIKSGQYSQYTRLKPDGTTQTYRTNSHQRTLDKGRSEICDIVSALSIGGGDDTVNSAHRIYVIAVEREFTRGRRTRQVAASALYIVCRQTNKPYLLIDFADQLQTSVYVLGAVFLQLCNLLRLDQHPMVQKPVDPSLFIHRFTSKLLQKVKLVNAPAKLQYMVANTALRIVASMKHDWMQTGRRPSGICGAALLLSARIHGIECTKADLEPVVFVCKATIAKRLLEFSKTDAGDLTPEEFEAQAREREAEMTAGVHFALGSAGERVIKEVVCEHKDAGAEHYAHGLCRTCYDDFMKISGGLQGGSAPPAFQRAEKRRRDRRLLLKKAKAALAEDLQECSPEADEEENRSFPESLSDLDDDEMATYLNTEDEIRLKTIVWTEMNKEYLEEQEKKAEANKRLASNMEAVTTSGTPAEVAAASVVLEKKTKRPRQKPDPASKAPAATPAEATKRMLKRKRLSTKLNFNVVDKLFTGDEGEGASSSAVGGADQQATDDADVGTEVDAGVEPEGDATVDDAGNNEGYDDYGDVQEADEYYHNPDEEEDYYEEYG